MNKDEEQEQNEASSETISGAAEKVYEKEDLPAGAAAVSIAATERMKSGSEETSNTESVPEEPIEDDTIGTP